ncbi:MAG TPA: hypothetical protein VMT50_06660, partial [Steroidobacteraceae bacterium]|nr:hypothetical protein [Steroidobacteraceae bacterium]
NREDTIVVDEPFYAHYLKTTGLDHPGREEIIAHQEGDWRRVVDSLLAAPPAGVQIVFQKQMSHHLLPNIGREWLDLMTHAFLIRDPRPMIASLGEKLADFDLPDTGLPQQVEIFEHVLGRTGRVPPVVDSADLLARPEATLRALCEALGVPFSPRMLWWPKGRRTTDGIWAKYWYHRVEQSTGFEPAAADGPPPELSVAAAAIEAKCRPMYEQLRAHRLRA